MQILLSECKGFRRERNDNFSFALGFLKEEADERNRKGKSLSGRLSTWLKEF